MTAFVLRPERHCEQCGKRLEPCQLSSGYLEATGSFNKRKFCSSQCFGDSIRKEPPTMFCQHCGKQLVRKVYSGGGVESYPEMLKRKFCDRKCKGAALSLPNGPRWGGLPHRGRKVARRKKARDKCERCGGTRRVEVHHKDGDATNNDTSNLEALCLWCHRKEHKNEGCKVPGCDRPYCGLGYCNRHYLRFKKYGDPLVKCIGRGKPQRVAV